MQDKRNAEGLSVRVFSRYWKGALTGLGLFILLWIVFFFCAFMTAFGNETSWSKIALRAIEAFFVVANPLWGIPASLIIGALVIDRK